MPHYGKYRGTVVNNLDPEQRGRLQAVVPDVLGLTPSGWALPCLPPGGLPVMPEIDSQVWIEFEGGDLDAPIWCGVFWSDAAQTPDALHQPASPDTLSLRTRDGAGIEIGPAGIVVDNGRGARIALRGPTVSINNGALDIT